MSQNQPVKVFLADRYPHFRDNIKSVFRKKEIEVSGEADSAEDLIQQLESNKPDLLITAHRLLDESAESFLPLIKEKYPDIKILLLTLNCHKKVFLKYVDYLDGMLCKMARKEELLDAINDITKKDKLYFRVNKYAEEVKDQRQNKLR
jgi:DNA-binding NarL/FixJ family response regulator